MSDLYTVRVAAAVIYQDGKVLACQRSDCNFTGVDLTGFWEFPGGKIEEGEKPADACKREVAEELGVRLSTVQYLDTIEHDYETFHISMECFVCQLLPGEEPKALEHSEIRWLGLDELTSVEWLPADRAFVNTLGHFWGQIFSFDDRF